MKVTIFAQKKETKEGKKFYTYLAKINKKDGSVDTLEAKFREECGAPDPKKCPLIIEVDKSSGSNISEKKEKYTDEVGEEKEVTRRRFWIAAWSESDEKYFDTSLDEYED